jgi:hypothetical protein
LYNKKVIGMARKKFDEVSKFESPKRNLLKKIRLFRGSGTGGPSVSSCGDEKEDVRQPIGYNPQAYAITDKRLHEIEAQKAMTFARTLVS